MKYNASSIYISFDWLNAYFSFLRVLRPPGGGSSNLFGGYEDDSASSRRPNKMASSVFSAPEEPQNVTRRSNPPGQAFPFEGDGSL